MEKWEIHSIELGDAVIKCQSIGPEQLVSFLTSNPRDEMILSCIFNCIHSCWPMMVSPIVSNLKMMQEAS